MALIVQKYGGTSVGSIEKIKNVAKKVIATKNQGNQLVVVVSAMGNTTDDLIALKNQIAEEVSPREYDTLISTGENISAALLAIAIQDQKENSISLTGWQAGVLTEDIHMKCKILDVDSSRIKAELAQGKIVVITGFQGINSKGDITTIGRGGSDTSAVVIAAALNADVCEIYTDVDGIYTTDPRKLPHAKKLETISHEEMLEMASLGAGVMHPRAVETAKVNKMNLHVKHSHKEGTGTQIIMSGEKTQVVSGIATDDNIAKIGVMHVPDIPGVAAKLFGSLAAEKINVDVIVQSIHEIKKLNDISFTVSKDDYKKSLKITKAITSDWKETQIVGDTKVAKISIVGIGMISAPGVAAKMFHALGKEKINIQMISTSEIKVSCIIAEDHLVKAIRAIHDEFELHK
ncbi:MAG: aspartate kinase [Candidatus Omnitrophica bacterium]|nr:aspartate kinase [Candidatus Margulisiibacteriota bacterium]MBU1868888.1 aspartate kinase [Candidatus Omnitrophota bacterium]